MKIKTIAQIAAADQYTGDPAHFYLKCRGEELGKPAEAPLAEYLALRITDPTIVPGYIRGRLSYLFYEGLWRQKHQISEEDLRELDLPFD